MVGRGGHLIVIAQSREGKSNTYIGIFRTKLEAQGREEELSQQLRTNFAESTARMGIIGAAMLKND